MGKRRLNECHKGEDSSVAHMDERPQKNAKEKFRSYKEKADRGDAASQYCLAKLYAAGHGTKKDSSQSIHYLELSAEKGYFKAQKTLVKSFLKKRKADISALLFKWAWVGVEMNEIVENLRNLAERIWKTGKTQEDVKLAIRILWKTGEYGDSLSYYLIGLIFESYRKYAWAFQNFQGAVNLGYGGARLKIAEFQERGDGCTKELGVYNRPDYRQNY